MNKLVFAQRFLLLITSLITGSASAPFIICIGALPSQAATLAASDAMVELNNFNHSPTSVDALTDTNTFTFASNGSVTAEADANALAQFDPNNPPEGFSNVSLSHTSGEGSSYRGLAESLAGVIGYNFIIGSGETFSFDFQDSLDLASSVDNPKLESASADGNIALKLYDSTDPNNLLPLDYLTISGNLATPGNGNSLNIDRSANISFNSSETSIGGTKQSAEVSVQGSLSRNFDRETHLTLEEFKTNQASVSASVPEPSQDLALLFGFGLVCFGETVRRKAFGSRSKGLPF
ncbi:MAG: hypothetical protein JOZ78_13230 [Chroococcidiopsidaceae cyanobacterium CP_BM_ER_R8_30]|nr:hypothetical protein [Chroococcidiopsidaceae cyanobacterium CP_BM_ER_R8_30]